jgi:hypothetical protein
LSDDFEFFGGKLAQEERDFYLHPDNCKAFYAFTHVQSQWVLDSKDRKFALDYQRAEIAWQKLGFDIRGDDFSKVQLLERYSRESV